MDSLLPVATQSATQTVFITTTGVERGLTILGAVTIIILASIGLLTILVNLWRAYRLRNKN